MSTGGMVVIRLAGPSRRPEVRRQGRLPYHGGLPGAHMHDLPAARPHEVGTRSATMHILQVHNSYRQRGGEDTVVAVDAQLLRSAGHAVTQYIVPNPVRSIETGMRLGLSLWNPAAGRRFRRQLEATMPDVVHIHNTWFSITPSAAYEARRAGLPVVMTLHNYRLSCANGQFFRAGLQCTDCLTGSALNGLLHRCYQDSFTASAFAAANTGVHRQLGTWTKNVDLFLCLTEFAKARFVQAGIPAGKLRVRHNCAEDADERTLPASRSRQVAYIGRLASEKGVHVLLEAWRLARMEDCELLVVGDGPEREALQAMRVPGVRFTGPVEHQAVLKTLRSVRALVFPSLWFEGEPMIVVEALAAGTPVLASDVGGVPELLGHGLAGWLTKAGDVDAWRRSLRDLRGNADVDAKSRAARDTYMKQHTPLEGLRGLVGTYESLASLTALPPGPGVTK
jgi:glycosyltransferase involved in cell wall biosynthesis